MFKGVVRSMRKTKIICTLGPSTDNEETLKQLMLNGMDVARVNMSHQDHDTHRRRANMVKKLREEVSLPVALLLDTKGPEIRTGTFAESKVLLKKGQKFTLTTDDIEGDVNGCSISFKDLPRDVRKDSTILIDDGLIELSVDKVVNNNIECTVVNGGTVSSNKGINVPGVQLSLPFLNEKDKSDIKFAVEEDFDFIAASFTRTADDIIALKKELKKYNCDNIKIIAKIENGDGVKNIDDILRVADGIMVARGDLGVEIPIEDIPIIQKMLIKKAFEDGRIVITATQMLDSMIKNPRPTRAETTDVANAIYDGTSAIMLSGETAAGAYPVEAVKTMSIIAKTTEKDIDYLKRFRKSEMPENPNVTSAISHAACTTAHDLNAKAILAVSKSGRTAKMISKFRPNCPIIGGTTEPKVLRQMNLFWGVIPVMIEEQASGTDLLEYITEVAKKGGYVNDGDLVVISAGVPVGISGSTNLIKVDLVGDVLVTGTSVTPGIVCGNLCVCKNEQEARKRFKNGDILVIPETSNGILNIMKYASAIITENNGINSHAAVVGLALDKPVMIGAYNATNILKNGTTVTVDCTKGLIFSGTC